MTATGSAVEGFVVADEPGGGPASNLILEGCTATGSAGSAGAAVFGVNSAPHHAKRHQHALGQPPTACTQPTRVEC